MHRLARHALAFSALAAFLVTGSAASASAQRRFSIDARVGSGLSVGGGDGQASMRHTPMYVEAGLHSWVEEDQSIVLGGSLRVEVEERASIGGVLRAGFRYTADMLELRPSIAFAAILAPYTLLGPEAGLAVLLRIAPPLAIVVQVVVDGWVFGSDLAPGTVLVMVNGAAGVEIQL